MKSPKTLVRDITAHPLARNLDLDSPEATEVHSRLIREKKFLRRLYDEYYTTFLRASALSPPGMRLEIGAGGGFLKEKQRDIVTLDLRPGAHVDITGSALHMPVADGAVGALFMLNVLHHLSDVERFFEETARVLCPGGRAIFIEPYVSPLSKIIYSSLHHEPFDPNRRSWTLPATGPMSSANGALPWIVFVRDRARFEELFPTLRIERVTPHTALLYLLSGGVSMRSLAPGVLFAPVAGAEALLGPHIRHVASMMTVELVHTKA